MILFFVEFLLRYKLGAKFLDFLYQEDLEVYDKFVNTYTVL